MMPEDSIWMYDPSFALAIVGCVVYSLLFIAITYLTFLRYRSWYFTVVVVGAAIEVAGYVCRVYSTKNQSELTPFIMTLTLTVLAPILIAAGNYLLISRLIRLVLPAEYHRIFGIPGHRLTPIFVGFDIFSFMVQGSGSGIASSGNWVGPKADTGRYTLIGGLVLQLIAFSLFLAIFRRFHILANRFEVAQAPTGWRKVVLSVYVSSSMIMVRCVYRVCEFAEGMEGYAFRNEWLFWVFEALPMVIAIGIFCLYHPSRHLGRCLVMSKEGSV